MTSDKLGALANALGCDYAAMAYLGAVLGPRWGQRAGLRVGRLDFLNGRLIVAEQITRGRKGAVVSGPPKCAQDGAPSRSVSGSWMCSQRFSLVGRSPFAVYAQASTAADRGASDSLGAHVFSGPRDDARGIETA